jgi:DNA-binding transcriptional ArsR family regulator
LQQFLVSKRHLLKLRNPPNCNQFGGFTPGTGGGKVKSGRENKKTASQSRRAALEAVKNLVGRLGFRERARKRAEDFTRERKMPFKKLIYFLLSMIKESSQNALERYFGKLGEATRMSQQAFSQALREIFETTVRALCGARITRWRRYRLLAIDGSKINLPNDPDVREYFGVIGGEGLPCAQLCMT